MTAGINDETILFLKRREGAERFKLRGIRVDILKASLMQNMMDSTASVCVSMWRKFREDSNI